MQSSNQLFGLQERVELKQICEFWYKYKTDKWVHREIKGVLIITNCALRFKEMPSESA